MPPVDELQSTITNLLSGRDVLNTQLIRDRAAKRARAYALQGLYLVAVRSFESFLEDQIFRLACNKVQWASRRLTSGVRVTWSNRLRENRPEMVKTIILGGLDYVDYLPYERSVEIAKLLFKGGRPFVHLEQPHKDSLVRCQRVRNYIAHDSDFAYDKFIRSYSAIKPIRLAHPRPIHYLDDQIRAGVTLFEHDLTQLLSIARYLS